jgi:glycosyl hydrolase family 113
VIVPLGALTLALALGASDSTVGREAVPALGRPPEERGIGLGLFSSDPEYAYEALLEEIKRAGATHVMITWVWWQDDLSAGEIGPVEGWSASDPQVERTIAAARSLGLRVGCLPIVRLKKSSKTEWRGKIAPKDEDAWWRSYRAFILHASRLSANGGADRFSVGSELLSRERMRDRWADLIEEIRSETPSLELMYSANWDHYREVSFWDLVDVVGLTAYFELTKSLDPTVEELEASWKSAKAPLEEFSKTIGRPLVLTELGYPSLDGGASWPWDETRKAPIDLEEQRRAYAAAAKSWSNVRFVQGLYWWNWFGFGGSTDTNYTPRNKPAADVIRAWYRPSE